MENKEEKPCCDSDKGGCCGKGCCCAKALMAVVLLLIGGIVGYLMGGRCHSKKMWDCPMGAMSAPVTPPSK